VRTLPQLEILIQLAYQKADDDEESASQNNQHCEDDQHDPYGSVHAASPAFTTR
jgi:hypothetical protein